MDLDLHDVLDRLTDSVTIYDREARLLYMNAAAARPFGKPAQELLGRKPWELVASGASTPFREALLSVLAGGPKTTVVSPVQALALWYESDIYPYGTGALIVARDVTERVNAVENLRASEERFRAIFDYAPESILIFDPDTGAILDANHQAVTLLGYGREQLLAKRVAELSPPRQPDGQESGAVAQAHLVQVLDGVPREFEWMGRDIHGNDIPCEIRMARFPSPDRPLVRVSVSDLREKKRLQEKLVQAQRLEVIGRLAGGVAHDFNNMLSVILGTTELLQHKVDPRDPMHENFAEIAFAAQRAALVTRQLLAFGRRQRTDARHVDLARYIESSEKMLRRILGEDVDLDLSLSHAGVGVRIDQAQVEQLLLNLVINARDAMPRGGRVRITTSELSVDSGSPAPDEGIPPGRYVVLAVTDAGEGMSESVRAHLFEPFFTTKEFGKGTGLGLATVQDIVQRAGGYVGVASVLGAGTTFRVYLLAMDRPGSEAPEPRPMLTQQYLGTETVLVVEDDDSVRRFVRDALRYHGYNVLEARNAGEALLVAEQHSGSIALLLTDVVLPRMSGPLLAARLSAVLGDFRVLFMSGYDEARLGKPGGPIGSESYLRKPIGLHDLLSSVRGVLNLPLEAKASSDRPSLY